MCMVMGCVVSVYLDKRGPVVGLWVAPVTLVLSTGTVQPAQTQSVSLMLQCTHRLDVHMQAQDAKGLALYL